MVSLEFAGKVSCNHARPELASPQDTGYWIVLPDRKVLIQILMSFDTFPQKRQEMPPLEESMSLARPTLSEEGPSRALFEACVFTH